MQKTLQLTNDIAQIPLLGVWIKELGKELPLQDTDVFKINLALEEAVVNVINYAFPDNPTPQTITLVAKTLPNSSDNIVVFSLEDGGVPFDPTQSDAPDITSSASERNIGGLGIFLVQQLMHDVTYQHIDGKNVLTMHYAIGQE